jgi:hypothetical protein
MPLLSSETRHCQRNRITAWKSAKIVEDLERGAKVKKLPLMVFALQVACMQTVWANDKDDFPLKLHITAIEMVQGNNPVSGSGSTDSNGNYSSSVGGGGSYYWHLFTGNIDGEAITYKFSTRAMRGFMKHAAILHIGDYSARWNKNGSLTGEDSNLQPAVSGAHSLAAPCF